MKSKNSPRYAPAEVSRPTEHEWIVQDHEVQAHFYARVYPSGAHQHQLVIAELGSVCVDGRYEFDAEVYSCTYFSAYPLVFADSVVRTFSQTVFRRHPVELVHAFGGTLKDALLTHTRAFTDPDEVLQ